MIFMVDRINEEQPSPALSQAVQQVESLYQGEMLGEALGSLGSSVSNRDILWAETSQNNPEYAYQITQLRQVTKNSREIRQKYGRIIEAAVSVPFAGVSDVSAQALLRDLLVSRISTPDGQINSQFTSDEHTSLRAELGIRQNSDLAPVTIGRVVTGVLTGRIRMARAVR